jgi:hypothetical protein
MRKKRRILKLNLLDWMMLLKVKIDFMMVIKLERKLNLILIM